MSRYNHSTGHRDKNHAEVRDHLRKHGVEVVEIFDPLDLLCFYRGLTALVEVKPKRRDATYTRRQMKFIAETNIPVTIAKDGEAAMEFLQTKKGLTAAQKRSLTFLLLSDPSKTFRPVAIEKALAI